MKNDNSFGTFVFRTRVNRRFIWIALIGSIVQLTAFKLLYPYPDFMSDSYDYIGSAVNHLNVNLWPIGYAKFLQLVHQINYGDTFLITMQYCLVQLSLLFFYFTINYLYRPSALTAKILFAIIFFNPASLYISNYVLSDALFGCITIIWFTLLLWQLKYPKRLFLFGQLLLIGLAFTIRYTAMYYPLIAAVALLISPLKWPERIAWMVAPALLFIPFIRFTQLQTKEVTGTAEFSVFGDWQIANNALYMYGYIQVDSAKLPPETRGLDRMVKQFYKLAPAGYIDLDDFDGTYFIKHPDAPLKQYMWRHYRKEQDTSSFLAWGKVSPMYNKYGSWLVSHYPLAFARHYLWLNTKNYFSPYLAQMGLYNMGDDEVWDYAQIWFHYPSLHTWSISKKFQGFVFFSYPVAFLLLNFYFAACCLWLWVTGKSTKLEPIFRNSILLLAAIWLVNAGFSILATPVVLRYELVPLLLLFTFSMLLLEFTEFKKSQNA